MNPILIGTGFYCTQANHDARVQMWHAWLKNTRQVSDNIVVIDNSDQPLPSNVLGPARVIRNRVNLGHVGDSRKPNVGPILGWSMSWIQPALVAYTEGCDFIYKEQDCFSFGDWLPIVRQPCSMTTGRHSLMQCEQSLFFLQRDFILRFIQEYLKISILFDDTSVLPEDKFRRIMKELNTECAFHDLPGGRDRPLPDLSKPFYAQHMTTGEIALLMKEKLL